MRLFFFISIIVIGAVSCDNQGKDSQGEGQALFTLIDTADSGLHFANILDEGPGKSNADYDYYYNGGGVAVGDINNDGLPDLFFTGNSVSNRLYLNKGNFQFEDITDFSGLGRSNKWSTGAVMADINQDGWLDIYVCNSGPNRNLDTLANECYLNNGDLTFTEKARELGIANAGQSVQATFFDYDRDGDEDLLVMNHSALYLFNYKFHNLMDQLRETNETEYRWWSNAFYRNNGNGTFTEATKETGLLKPGFGLGLVASDLNQDGWTDLYVANDYFLPDFMYINNGNGTFTDKINSLTNHISYFSMGCDAADLNNDGLLDIAVADMAPADHVRSKRLMASMNVPEFYYLTGERGYQPQFMFNVLQINRGGGAYSEVAQYAGIAKTDWSWSKLAADLDLDGWKDLIVTNGYWRETKDNDMRLLAEKLRDSLGTPELTDKQEWELTLTVDQKPLPNYFFRNEGKLKFENAAEAWGINQPSFSNGAAYADLDLDGDLDLVINNIGMPAFLYRNNATEVSGNHFLGIRLKDSKSPWTLQNTKVTIYTPEGKQYVETSRVRGYQSSMENTAYFGLGKNRQVEKIEIQWPDATLTTIDNPGVDRVITVDRSGSQRINAMKPQYPVPPFYNLTPQSEIDFVHRENFFNDFAEEVLIPHRQSQLGPALAVGDVNNDGFEDFYIGGALGQTGRLYLQVDTTGKFTAAPAQPWTAHTGREDLGAHFFDADGDDDLDLYLASGGGGEVAGKTELLQDRLYLNDGTGTFSDASDRLPRITVSSKVLASADYDGDGDLDLFVGGRNTPGAYPLPASSLLLRNEGNTFVDASSELAPMLQDIGMVTGAVWSDFSGDGRPDLVLAGEWLSPRLLENRAAGFTDVSDQYLPEAPVGWFLSLAATDVDGDGDEDFIFGNIGENNKFHPSDAKPLHVFANDFDENGSLDIVLSNKYHSNLVPVRGRECSSQQMPFIVEKYPQYKGFAEASLDDIYGAEKLADALHYEANDFSSFLLINNGPAPWEFRDLSYECQLAPVQGILPYDFDQDGDQDLVLVGNYMDTEVETPAYDGGKGLFLENDGQGNFTTSLNIMDSGIYCPFNAKGIAGLTITPDRMPAFLVANNNYFPQLFAYIKKKPVE